MNVTKADIVDKIATQTGLTKFETKAVVDGFLLSIIESLADGKRIELRGFGVFSVKSRKPRMARNPRTGEPVPLEERFIPTFKVSSEFQDKVHTALRGENASEGSTPTPTPASADGQASTTENANPTGSPNPSNPL